MVRSGSVRALSQESGEGRVEAECSFTHLFRKHVHLYLCMQFLIRPSEFEKSTLCLHNPSTVYAHITENAKGLLRIFKILFDRNKFLTANLLCQLEKKFLNLPFVFEHQLEICFFL